MLVNFDRNIQIIPSIWIFSPYKTKYMSWCSTRIWQPCMKCLINLNKQPDKIRWYWKWNWTVPMLIPAHNCPASCKFPVVTSTWDRLLKIVTFGWVILVLKMTFIGEVSRCDVILKVHPPGNTFKNAGTASFYNRMLTTSKDFSA